VLRAPQDPPAALWLAPGSEILCQRCLHFREGRGWITPRPGARSSTMNLTQILSKCVFNSHLRTSSVGSSTTHAPGPRNDRGSQSQAKPQFPPQQAPASARAGQEPEAAAQRGTGRDGTHGGGFVGRPSNLSLSWRSALVRVERVMPSSLMFSSGCFWM